MDGPTRSLCVDVCRGSAVPTLGRRVADVASGEGVQATVKQFLQFVYSGINVQFEGIFLGEVNKQEEVLGRLGLGTACGGVRASQSPSQGTRH